jgi:hypothetical protein
MPLAEGGDNLDVEELCSIKRRRGSASDEALGMKNPRKASAVGHSKDKEYSLRSVTLGFVNKQLGAVQNTTTCGMLTRSWPEWLNIDTILTISITWICLQDQRFAKSLASLLPNVTFLQSSPTMMAHQWIMYYVLILCRPRIKICGLTPVLMMCLLAC